MSWGLWRPSGEEAGCTAGHCACSSAGECTCTNTRGEPLLRFAATRGNLRVFHQLLEEGEDLSSQGHGGNTPLHYLCETVTRECNRECTDGRVDAVKRFLEKGAPVCATNLIGETPLHCAVKKLAESLRGDDFSREQKEGWDANRARIVGALLGAGADEEAQCTAGWSPLDIAKANPNRVVLALVRAHNMEKWKRHFLAFAMCQHERLGENSVAHCLDDNARSLIFSQLSGRKSL